MSLLATQATTPSDRLADDLGDVLDDLLDRTAQSVAVRLDAHGVSFLDVRLLRTLDRAIGSLDLPDLCARADLAAGDVERALPGLRARDLLAGPLHALRLTPDARVVLRDIERARRAGLRAFVADLDRAQRLRVEAAVHLLSGDLGPGRLAP